MHKIRLKWNNIWQVPDPREKNWLPYTEGHERWWDAIWKAAEERGDKEVTVTTEFGPPNYQVTFLTLAVKTLLCAIVYVTFLV